MTVQRRRSLPAPLCCGAGTDGVSAAVDLEIEATPTQDLHAFEVFVSSYFDAAFTNAAAYVAEIASRRQAGLMSARQETGYWLMFLRRQQRRSS